MQSSDSSMHNTISKTRLAQRPNLREVIIEALGAVLTNAAVRPLAASLPRLVVIAKDYSEQQMQHHVHHSENHIDTDAIYSYI